MSKEHVIAHVLDGHLMGDPSIDPGSHCTACFRAPVSWVTDLVALTASLTSDARFGMQRETIWQDRFRCEQCRV